VVLIRGRSRQGFAGVPLPHHSVGTLDTSGVQGPAPKAAPSYGTKATQRLIEARPFPFSSSLSFLQVLFPPQMLLEKRPVLPSPSQNSRLASMVVARLMKHAKRFTAQRIFSRMPFGLIKRTETGHRST